MSITAAKGGGGGGGGPALSQLISQVSVLAAQQASEISEIELNPVLVHAEGQGVTIVDALVVRKKA